MAPKPSELIEEEPEVINNSKIQVNSQGNDKKENEQVQISSDQQVFPEMQQLIK